MLTPPAALHALLFASSGPLEKSDLASYLGCRAPELAVALDALRTSLKGSGLTLVETETEVELRTAPEAAPVVQKLRENELSRDLGKASLETLAVIAYQTTDTGNGNAVGADGRSKGTTRSHIDWVRGVNSSASLRTLLMRGLIEGREDPSDKRRIQYRLTTEALAHLGVARIQDLPRYGELAAASGKIIEEEALRATQDQDSA